MATVAEVVDAVIGVDTHRDTHTLELTSPVGATLAVLEIPNTPEGFTQALGWICEHAPGPRIMTGLEGTRSYGIGLSRAFQAAGLVVIEIERRGKGKSDPIDARLACLSLLRMDLAALPQPRADGAREALRILLNSREEQSQTQTRQSNQLHALLLTGDDTDRALGKGRFTLGRLQRLIDRPLSATADVEELTRHTEAIRLAQAILRGHRALTENYATLRQIVQTVQASLLDKRGVGPVSAAQSLVTFSHHGRFRHEAAFAMVNGSAPLPASSGHTRRHRLNRGGDRAMNRALHTIVMSRWRTCPETASYIAKRRAQGKSDREIRRCLKRYVSRELFRAMTTANA